MRTYKLTIAYDGSRYQGWQRQSNTDKTVQGLLEQAASETAGYPLEVQGSGRTDGGVHANGFHARLSAVGKCYEYWIDMREKPDVFMRKYTYHYPKELNIEAMQRAADDLIGRYDFAAFTDKKEEKSTIRTIYAIIVEVQGDKLRIEYRGSGFMYHMVRILTGTLLEVGDGRRTPESVKAALAGRDRADAGFLAPARGLTLKEVYY